MLMTYRCRIWSLLLLKTMKSYLVLELLLCLPVPVCCVCVQAEATEHTDDGGVYSQVDVGYGTSLRFCEDPQLGSLETQKAVEAYEGWHCAVYVQDFEGTYSRVVQAGINQTDHLYKDKADTLEGAKRWNQFRFCNIIAVEDSPPDAVTAYRKGQLLYRFGHELRSLEHRRCPKLLLGMRTHA